MLILLLYSLYTLDCVARHSSNTIFQSTDETTDVGQIMGNDGSEYRKEIDHLIEWCQNVKSEELIVDLRIGRWRIHKHVFIDGAVVESLQIPGRAYFR